MYKDDKEFLGCASAFFVLAFLANLVFWGTLIWLVFFLFDRYVG